MGSIESPDIVLIKPSSACSVVHSILVAHGVPQEHATYVADALVLADLRGVDSHGINRLPSYISRLEAGALNPAPKLEFQMKTPIMALLDAQNTFGFVAASMAIDKGIEMASAFGMGVVAVKHSNHYGMASAYLCRAIEQGYAAMAFTNSSRSMPPWGAKEPLFGTSPFAIGLPGGDEGDFILDMSPSVAARGKIRKAARRKERIPEGYALDEYGRPTTDPEAALRGVVLPIGGPKGSGIAMMMDIFGGLLTGAAFKGDVVDMNKNKTDPQNVGHWFMVFKPDVFLDSRAEYETRMNELMRAVRECDKAEGVKRIFTPGEIEAELALRNRLQGISYTSSEVASINKLAEQSGSTERLVSM
ncbi:hypothetical protein PV08_08452 [Exophiala spinifera]|uniref:Malate/L-lactate dehydrogenase n=1 Tax=Exophiala spinifera TaxID=91928 RepID=A0A0D2B3L9_9EURO|nr:uncharacterized protein PV08_08452 [Exophiala spinifera]KIW13265.1 hypothetical protein PV08_08452 [Exophiala spinifera]